VPAAQALEVMSVIEAAVRSARQGSWEVPEAVGPDSAG